MNGRARGFRPCGRGGRRGMTMIEMMMAIVILGIGIVGVVAIVYVAGRLSQSAIQRHESARIARALHNYIAGYAGEYSQVWNPANAAEAFTVDVQDVPEAFRPNYAKRGLAWVREGGPLVWRCEVSLAGDPVALEPRTLLRTRPDKLRLFRLRIFISVDSDRNEEFDDTDQLRQTFVSQVTR